VNETRVTARVNEESVNPFYRPNWLTHHHYASGGPTGQKHPTKQKGIS
jgi:hypothetical protein